MGDDSNRWFPGGKKGRSAKTKNGSISESNVVSLVQPGNPPPGHILYMDPDWPLVQGDWVGGKVACSADPDEARAQTMVALAELRAAAPTPGDRSFIAGVYERLGHRDLGLPDFPETPIKLEQLMSEEEPNSQQIMRCIESDPKLVGRVWQRARSARFPSAPSSLDMAVSRIGMVTVWRLSLESALDGVEVKSDPYQGQVEILRVHGAAVGEVTAGLHGHGRGPAFLAGLLHDVGWLVLMQAAEHARPSEGFFKAVADAHHAAISVMVADAWRLTPEILPVLACHHNPDAIQASDRDLCRLLCLADIAVEGELHRRSGRNSRFIDAMAQFTQSRVLASKAIHQAALALDRIQADG